MEEQEPSQDYLRGFNRGYIMRKHKPDIKFKTVTFSDQEVDHLRGFKAGVVQYEKEIDKSFDMDKQRLNPARFKDVGKDNSPTKD